MLDIIIWIIFLIWLIIFLINKKRMIITLPYLLPIFITPLYNYLDKKIIVKIFGCGCVPLIIQNKLNIPINANHIRLIVFSFLTIMMFIWGAKLSTSLKNNRRLYKMTIVFFNIIYTIIICKIYLWK